MATTPVLGGRVASFDDDRGEGVIESDGGASMWFHCTSIHGGSRHIAVGARVTFEPHPGNLGAWEAVRVISDDPGLPVKLR